MNFNLEKGMAEALLDVGVSVPLKEVRIPWKKDPLIIRLVMRRPLLGNLIRISSEYMKIGVTYEELTKYDKEQQILFISQHGKEISKIVSLAILGSHIYGKLLVGILSWTLRWIVDDAYIIGAFNIFISQLRTKDFENIIRSLEGLNPMSPILSHEKKGS